MGFYSQVIHGEDRDDVLSPDWKPLQQLNDIKPRHPLIHEIAQGSFRQKHPCGPSIMPCRLRTLC